MKNQAELISWITKLERENHVENLSYRGERIWPILRLHLFSPPPFRACDVRGVRKYRRLWSAVAKTRKWERAVIGIRNHPSNSVIFLEQTSKWTEMDGKPFHRFFDPILSCAENESRIHFVWSDSVISGEAARRDAIPFEGLIQSATEQAMLKSPSLPALSSEILAILNSWKEMTGDSVDAIALKVSFDTYFELRQIFCRALQGGKHLLFITCFYSVPAFALVAAVRDSGGVAAEVQHGQQGASHPMYTNWEQRRAISYKMIPDLFCMWGKKGVKRIASWSGKMNVAAIEAGNTWLGYSLQNKPIEKRENEKTRVLVSMQYSDLPEFVWLAAAQMKEAEWTFRVHPRLRSEVQDLRERCLQRLGKNTYFEVDEGKNDFYEVIQEADVHLTGWSTTCFEALHFGVPSILIHPNALSSLASEVQEGVFGYASSSAQLIEGITNPPPIKLHSSGIIADIQFSQKVFAEIVRDWKHSN